MSLSPTAKKRICLLAVLLWLCFIFFQSRQNGASSSAQSEALTQNVQSVALPEADFTMLNLLLRKSAHVAEFAVLGGLLVLTLTAFGIDGKHRFPFAAAGLFIGLCDETIQMFSPGRSSNISDVWLDGAGYLLGFTLMIFFLFLLKKRRCKPAPPEHHT